MKRLHLVELEDLPWCPPAVRDGATDCLQFSINLTRLYSSVAPHLCRALKQTGATRVVDLCSGGGGPWLHLHRKLHECGAAARVCLSDRYPNIDAFAHMQRKTGGAVEFTTEPVDALAVPATLTGFRTLFSSVHHFRPQEVQAILHDAVAQRQGIGLFDAVQRRPHVILTALLVVPVTTLLLTPFIRPFRWSRLFWTYGIALIPLMLSFDGVVSCLRAYTPHDLRRMVDELGETGYIWEIGEQREVGSQAVITYVIGYPADAGGGSTP